MNKFILFCLLSIATSYAHAQGGAKFPGGNKAYNQFIKENLVLPDYIADGSKEGEVQVSFKVSNKGKLVI